MCPSYFLFVPGDPEPSKCSSDLSKQAVESEKISKEDIDRLNKKVSTILNEEFKNSKDYVPNKRDWLSAYWTGFKSPEQISRIRNTG